MGLLLSRAHSHGENNSLQSAFYTDHARFAWWVWSPLGHMKQSCSIKAMYNLAFPVFMSPVVWSMCENLHYESVHFKELHNDQEHYWPTIYRAGAAVWCQLLLVFIHNGEKLLYSPDLILLRKSSQRVQWSNDFMFHSHMRFWAPSSSETQGLLAANILSTRLTAPGSPRMGRLLFTKKFRKFRLGC